MMHKVTDLKKVPHHFMPVEKEQDSQSTQLPAT